jgi:hypothetical protein
MACCLFFLLKINRLFLIRDAKFKMNKKKNQSNSKFSTTFFSGETENQINFYINTEEITITTILRKFKGKKFCRFRFMST